MSSPPPGPPPPARKAGGKPKFNKLKLTKRTPTTGGALQGHPEVALPPIEPALDVLNFFDRSKESYAPRRKPRKRSPDPGGSEARPSKKGCVEGDRGSNSDDGSQGEQNRRAAERYSARPTAGDATRGPAAIAIRGGDSDVSLSPPLPPPPRRPSPPAAEQEFRNSRPPTSPSSDGRDACRRPPAAEPARLDGNVAAAGPATRPADREAVPNYEARMRARMRTHTSTAPVVNILVSSPIGGTKPLIIKRRLDQTLREVRQHWCKAQGFSATQMASVFLVWKGIRVSDFNSCKGIGISVDPDGNPDASTGGVVRGNVHLEAVTEAILQQLRCDEGKADDGDGEEEGETLRLALKTRDKDSYNVKVKPTTTIEALVETYRAAMDLRADQKVLLYFEGAILSPTDTVAGADLEDLCMVDVHIH